MDSMFRLLGELQSGDAARTLSQQLGTDERATSDAISASLPVLIGALTRNASQPAGAESLHNALARDHDGSILDDLMGALGGGQAKAGASILDHIFGGRQQTVESQIGRKTGLDASSIAQLLATLAPLVLGAMGRAQRDRGLDAGGLSDVLGQERSRADADVPGGLGPFEKMLDMDGDGDVSDDIARVGAQVLGSLFGGSR